MPIGGTDADVTPTELALTWAVSDSLQIDYAFAYTDTEVTVTEPGTVSNYPGAIRVGGSSTTTLHRRTTLALTGIVTTW